jgi:uncharacterized protein (DUF433 family)
MSAHIINRGRGPEIEGTRVTVYRVMDLIRSKCTPQEMAKELELTKEEVRAALEYIAAHRAEVEAEYEKIPRRVNRANPAWVEAGRAKSFEELRQRILARYRNDKGNAGHGGPDANGIGGLSMTARIIDRGRGPEIEGTRVTVYCIMDYLRYERSPREMAEELKLTDEQVQVALDYIHRHRAEVEAEYEKILQRVNQPNPAWVEALLAKTPEELRRRIRARFAKGNSHVDLHRQ